MILRAMENSMCDATKVVHSACISILLSPSTQGRVGMAEKRRLMKTL